MKIERKLIALEEGFVLNSMHDDVRRFYLYGGMEYAPWPVKVFYRIVPDGMLYSNGYTKPVVRKLDKDGYAKVHTRLLFNPVTLHWKYR